MMCGEGAVLSMEEKWNSLLPTINKLNDRAEESQDVDSFMALEVIDKQLRPAGAGAKSLSAYAIFEVYNYACSL